MTYVPRATYDKLHAELEMRIGDCVREFATDHGLEFDAGAFARQSSSAENGTNDLLWFGMDVWAAGSGEPDGGERVTTSIVPRMRSRTSMLGYALAAGLVLFLMNVGALNVDHDDHRQSAAAVEPHLVHQEEGRAG